MPPNKKASRKPGEKWQKMMPFLPCFFDVPSGDVQIILSISHHTLDPMRRAVGLDRWPYLEVMRDQFCMTSDEISAYRERMMGVADEEMKAILSRMAMRAAECRASNRPLAPMQRSSKARAATIKQEEAPPSLSALLAAQPVQPQGLAEETASFWAPSPELAFWDEISQLIMLDASPPGPAQEGLFLE